MNDRAIRRYDMFGRVETFGKDNAADFAAGSSGATHFTKLSQIITKLDAAKAGQNQNGTTAKEVLLDAIRLDMQNIARTARAIAQDEPGFADKFRIPGNPSQVALLTAADAFLVELGKPGVAAKFIAHEMAANFVASFQADRDAVDTAQDEMESGNEKSVGNTAAIGALIADGMKEVTYIDAIAHNKYGSQPDKMAAWQTASHVERDPQRAKNNAPTPPPPNP
ncbi:MAG: hypothetical protein QOD03_877 [Verrucomicrobiota bacterium]|jgi:hypothetical protein